MDVVNIELNRKANQVYYKREEYNHVLFILREPNCPNNGDGRENKNLKWKTAILNNWTEKECVREYGEKIEKATNYRKSFWSMLKKVGLQKEDLCNVAFDNIIQEYGERSVTEAYKQLEPGIKAECVSAILEMVKGTKYIFTCKDIYREIKKKWLKEHKNQKSQDVERTDGITYKIRGQLHKMILEDENGKIVVYEIYHPSLGWEISED